MLSAYCNSWECTARLFKVVLLLSLSGGLMPLAEVCMKWYSNAVIYVARKREDEGRKPAVALHVLPRSMCVVGRTQQVSRSPPPHGVCL